MNDVVKMSEYKKLLNKVKDLEDYIARLKRNYDDILSNIDIGNFSDGLIKTQGEMKSQIKQTAEEISSMVTKVDSNYNNLSTQISQTADEISLTAKKYADGVINDAKEEITADAITQTVSKTFSGAEVIDIPFNDLSNKDESKIYYSTSDEKYYYYDTSGEWQGVENNSIYSAFKQTADGFEFSGNLVKISGDLITEGSISGNLIKGGTIEGTNIKGAKFYSDISDSYYLMVTGDFGDLILGSSSKEIFKIKTSDIAAGALHLYAFGHDFLGYNASSEIDGVKGVTYPVGNWVFAEGATVDLHASKVLLPDETNVVAVFG